jgi:Fur family ferric uptake transcriptional regulator
MDLQTKLNNEGMRMTRPRQVVLSILEEATVPLSPQSIHQQSLDGNQEIGLVSVYRTLDVLMDLALVRKVHGQDGCHGYVLASPGHHHHLVCHECDRAVEFSGAEDLSNLVNRIQKETGFVVDGHLLQLYGLCPECQSKQKVSNNV